MRPVVTALTVSPFLSAEISIDCNMICGGPRKRTTHRSYHIVYAYKFYNSSMEDMPTTKGERSVPARSLTVPPTLTDAVPSGPPRYARHDDMRMPDRLLRFDK